MDKELDLCLGELALADQARARRDLVAEGLAHLEENEGGVRVYTERTPLRKRTAYNYSPKHTHPASRPGREAEETAKGSGVGFGCM